MAELSGREELSPHEYAWADRELCAALGRASLPQRLGDLAPIEMGLLMLAMQRSTVEEYPTELFESLASVDDCLHYMTTKRDRG